MPPDRLAVTLLARGDPLLRIELSCAVADRDACAATLSALADGERERECVASEDPADASILVSGTIAGEAVRSIATRRTDCETRVYERIAAGLDR